MKWLWLALGLWVLFYPWSAIAEEFRIEPSDNSIRIGGDRNRDPSEDGTRPGRGIHCKTVIVRERDRVTKIRKCRG